MDNPHMGCEKEDRDYEIIEWIRDRMKSSDCSEVSIKTFQEVIDFIQKTQ
jgi:hypothetical protein